MHKLLRACVEVTMQVARKKGIYQEKNTFSRFLNVAFYKLDILVG